MSAFKVPYRAVGWFKLAIEKHNAVVSMNITRYHFFEIVREKAPKEVNVVLVDIYTVGLADVLQARKEFPTATCIVTNGDWNAYTPEAKRYGLDNEFGVFTTTEFMGALNWAEVYKYHQKDEDGQPIYQTRDA